MVFNMDLIWILIYIRLIRTGLRIWYHPISKKLQNPQSGLWFKTLILKNTVYSQNTACRNFPIVIINIEAASS